MTAPMLAPNGRPLAEVYRAAAARVRRGWCREDYAQNEHGLAVDPNEAHATKWCGMGAICAEAGVEGEPDDDTFWALTRPLVTHLERRYGDGDPNEWNDADGQTAESVAADLDRVAADLEKGGAT